jgi:hypothetical protein
MSPEKAKGMYGGPRGVKGGDYSRGNLAQTSGAVKKEASTVNGAKDTVRKTVPRRKIVPNPQRNKTGL